MSVKRYSSTYDFSMGEDDSGAYVSHTDYEQLERELAEAKRLMRAAIADLEPFMFSGDGDDEWNNDDVIDTRNAFDAFLKQSSIAGG